MNSLTKAAMIFWGIFIVAGLLGGGFGTLCEIIWMFTKLLFWPVVILLAGVLVLGRGR